ncbi:P-loop containing nucleoside triphosphate hydrolase protein [Pseudomassariella vexata]|uniref:p-loop containing nucleoside triphosphate hydrolase protein n=1 Tax=Pseudomassariella vexata TaxID=1141098 RepID=A0A1Y2DS57_9PEZI|nr:P-loop containing nucleoside triphosphate hydrolase protein [Pseudomassariella vexata]ORY62103.1 P-loop containing nucleoside triphosphate hydrolase protein [Pseudomassariella vexata]
MSSSPEFANGTESPPADNSIDVDPVANDAQSDSDLSEVNETVVIAQPPSPSGYHHDSDEDANADLHTPDVAESSANEDVDASDDADFDVESPVPSNSDGGQRDRSASNDSRRAPKRKVAAVEEDEYIMANPELYGLRRSTRPTKQSKIVDSDDDGSDSDVLPTSRRATKKRRVEQISQQSSKRGTPARHTPAGDSDSEDTYGGARARTLMKKARREKAQPETAQLYAEKRWSNRRAAQQVQTYQESDVDDADDSELTPNYWAGEELADDSPYIEKVVGHRVKDGGELRYDATRDDFEYNIKWEGKSYLHNTWDTMEVLRGYRGVRKLENYHRKVVEYEIDLQFGGDDIPPETREQYLLDKEREQDALEDYTKVERVVAQRSGDEGREYFVKWKGLMYDCCTWELASAISEDAQDKIDQFLDRQSRSWMSDKYESNPATRTKFLKLDKQPSYIKGGELRNFQLTGLNFLCLNWCRANNVILADEMGLGKTVQTVAFLSWLRNERKQEGPFLVVAPLSVIPAWCDTFNLWSPDLNYVVYLGNSDARNTIREHELISNGNAKKTRFNVLVTSYEYILQDADFLRSLKWQALAVDEAHRLKNKESKLYSELVSFGAPSRLLITGTPIQNNLAELSSLLDFLNPGKVYIDEDLETLASVDAQAKLQALHASIAPFILRRTKETVESDLPPKTEKIIRVELSDVQLEWYKNILTRNYAALNQGNNGQKQSLLNIVMELKKVSNHPYMFAGVEDKVLAGSERREDQIKGLIASSGKMMLIDQLLTKLKKDNHRVLIFSQMVRMLDILGDYLRLRGYQFQRLDGTIGAGPRRLAINHFNAEDSQDFCFLLSTRAGGLGINLMTADTVIIFDSDWNPQADLQAMARAHRIGQKRPVMVYRLVSKETIEEEVLERARNKLLLEYLTIQAGVTDDGQAFREEFRQKGLRIDEAKSADDIQWVLKMRSQKMFEQSGNQERLEQLDIESILENAEITKTQVSDKMNLSTGGIDWDNFMQYTDVKVDDLTLDWDQIIPAEELAAIKEQEEKKKSEEYIAKVMEESAPRRAALKGSKSNNIDSERAERMAKKREREQLKQERLEEQRALLSDPKRPLNEKETRNLIRAFMRYGFMEDRPDELLRDARLSDRDHDFINEVLNDLMQTGRDAVERNNDEIRAQEQQTKKKLTKKDIKAVMFDFGTVKKINAETILERPPQQRLLRKILNEQSDFRNFRLTDATKAAHYSCEWGAKEDAMLLVGIDRYGFGAWTQIRDDRELGMQDKFFLEEHRIEKKQEREHGETKGAKAPGAVHLVRRSEYLLSVLTAVYSDDAEAKREVQNHHRNNKKSALNGHRRPDKVSASASPAPQNMKKAHRDRDHERSHSRGDHHRSRSHVGEGSIPRPDPKRKHSGEVDERRHKQRRVEEHRRTEDTRQQLEEEEDDRRNAPVIEALMQPIWPHVERVGSCTKANIPVAKARAKVLKAQITAIGDFIEGLHKTSGLDREKLAELKPKLWRFISKRIPPSEKEKHGKDNPDPIRMTGPRLARLYDQLKAQQLKEAEDMKQNNGDAQKTKSSDLVVMNGSSRADSSMSKH